MMSGPSLYKNNVEIARYLATLPSPTSKEQQDWTEALKLNPTQFIFDAVFENNPTRIQFAVINGGNINSKDKRGKTPLHEAASLGKYESVKILLALGANTEAQDGYYQTPLHLAVKVETKILSILIEWGANIQTQDANASTPLHSAVIAGHSDAVSILLAHNANPYAKNNQEKNVLEMAVWAFNTNTNRLNERLSIIHQLSYGPDQDESGKPINRYFSNGEWRYGMTEELRKALVIKEDNSCNLSRAAMRLQAMLKSVENNDKKFQFFDSNNNNQLAQFTHSYNHWLDNTDKKTKSHLNNEPNNIKNNKSHYNHTF